LYACATAIRTSTAPWIFPISSSWLRSLGESSFADVASRRSRSASSRSTS
jgi:hypothetical protein